MEDPQVTPETAALLTERYAEPDYAPPAPSRTAETVAELNGNIVISYYEEGQRYAAIGATEADARKLLAEQPDMCRVT